MFVTVAMDKIDQWDIKCFREEQAAKDDNFKEILELRSRKPNGNLQMLVLSTGYCTSYYVTRI